MAGLPAARGWRRAQALTSGRTMRCWPRGAPAGLPRPRAGAPGCLPALRGSRVVTWGQRREQSREIDVFLSAAEREKQSSPALTALPPRCGANPALVPSPWIWGRAAGCSPAPGKATLKHADPNDPPVPACSLRVPRTPKRKADQGAGLGSKERRSSSEACCLSSRRPPLRSRRGARLPDRAGELRASAKPRLCLPFYGAGGRGAEPGPGGGARRYGELGVRGRSCSVRAPGGERPERAAPGNGANGAPRVMGITGQMSQPRVTVSRWLWGPLRC